MKKERINTIGFNSIILFIIGILSILTGLPGAIKGVIELVAIVSSTDFNNILLTLIQSTQIYEIIGSIVEIVVGIILVCKFFKKKINNYTSEIPGMFLGLNMTYFTVNIINLLEEYAQFKTINLNIGPLILFLVVSFLIGLLIKFSKSHNYILYMVSLLATVLVSISYLLINYIQIGYVDILTLIEEVISMLLCALIFVFSISGTVFYIKHPYIADSIFQQDEDIDLVKENNRFKLVRVYSTRTKNNGAVKFLKLLSIFVVLIFFGASIYLFYRDFSLALLINISEIIQSGDATKITTMIFKNVLILYPLFMIFYSIETIYFILLNQTKKFGSLLVVMTFPFSYCIFYRSLFNYDSLVYILTDIRQIKNLNLIAIFGIIMVICLFLGFIFFGIYTKKVITGTFNENIKIFIISVVFYFLTTSIASISSMISLYQQNDLAEFIFVAVIYFVSILFFLFYILQLKFPFSEYCYSLRYKNKEEKEEVVPF